MRDREDDEDDVVWRVRAGDGWLYVYLLLEFQSTVDRHMAVRIMSYVGLLYQDLLRTGAVSRGKPLPPVVPVVLYNGQSQKRGHRNGDRFIFLTPHAPAGAQKPNMPAKINLSPFLSSLRK